jgi:hypothetical protein
MIHIVGTDRYYQVWTDAKREGAAKPELSKFQRYLSIAAKRLGAGILAEDVSEEWVKDQGPGATSVAHIVASKNGIRYRYCAANTNERLAHGLKSDGELWDKANPIAVKTGRNVVEVWRDEIRKAVQGREDFWLGRLKVRGLDKMEVIFVCDASHVDTFKATLGANGIQACIRYRDWPKHISSG